MKTRTGFVSNSSSSSFVIGLKQRPKTWEDLHVSLFGNMDAKEIRPDWSKPSEQPDFCATSHAVAQNIFNQIEDQDTVPDSLLEKICDPGEYPKFPFWDDVREGKPLKREMKERYAIEHPYCISPTNRFWKKAQKIEIRGRKAYDAKLNAMRKAKWAKIAPKFKGLKKFVIMTQTDGGEGSRILCVMECCWSEISRRINNVKLTAH